MAYWLTERPLGFNLYWDTLTVLDPLTIMLLWTKTIWGIRLAVAIMLSDILINSYVYTFLGAPVPGMVPLSLFLQSLFGVFVFTTAPGITK